MGSVLQRQTKSEKREKSIAKWFNLLHINMTLFLIHFTPLKNLNEKVVLHATERERTIFAIFNV
jgi:hypothetical protein